MEALTFIQDYSSDVTLDASLLGVSASGSHWNQGSHPIVSISNIESVLPNFPITLLSFKTAKNYGVYEDGRDSFNVVTYKEKVYQSLSASNLGNHPDVNPTDWLETNLDSLRIKGLIEGSKQKLISATRLNRKLIENQNIYSEGVTNIIPSGDLIGWTFKTKGSDYTKIRINQIVLESETSDAVSLYVVNKGILIDTLSITPNQNETFNYVLNGTGEFHFLVDSMSVKNSSVSNGSLNYKGFDCYPATSTADYSVSRGSGTNGFSFNVTAYLDSASYFDNNLIDMAEALKVQFAYDITMLFISGANSKSNRTVRAMDQAFLQEAYESLTLKLNSEVKSVIRSINTTFDKFLKSKSKFMLKRGTL